MSHCSPTDTSSHPLAWWDREPPPPTSADDVEYDASLDVDPDPDPYSQSDLDYFADVAADRYERWIFRDS